MESQRIHVVAVPQDTYDRWRKWIEGEHGAIAGSHKWMMLRKSVLIVPFRADPDNAHDEMLAALNEVQAR